MLVATGKRVPLTNNVVVDQGAVLELVDQIRVAMPEEVRQAQRITGEAGRIVEHAREESDAIIARAQEQAAHMLEGGSRRLAQQRAGEILEQATRDAGDVRHGADEYAAGVLIRLEGEVTKALTSIKHGIEMLDQRRGPATVEAIPIQPEADRPVGTPASG